jgi:Helix-turn-helix domain
MSSTARRERSPRAINPERLKGYFRTWMMLKRVYQQYGPTAPTHLAFWLLDHANVRTGICIPSYATLAKEAGMTRETAIRAAKRLAVGGWIVITARRKSETEQLTNQFTFNWSKVTKNGDADIITSPQMSPGDDEGVTSPSNDRPASPSDAEVTERGTDQQGTDQPRTGQYNSSGTDATDDDFMSWWLQYPRKVAINDARRAYHRVVESGQATAADLMRGAMRYAAERDGQDQKYTKSPANWLRGGCWRDEPASASSSNGSAAVAAAMDGEILHGV